MRLENMTNAELVLYIDNLPDATPMMRELANRLDATEQKAELKQMAELKKLMPGHTELFKEET